MEKFKVVCDKSRHSFGSTHLIVDAINKAAKELDIYDENGLTVCYDTLCNSHGYDPIAFWCALETTLPYLVIQNANNKPILGLSKDNAWFFADCYPRKLIDWVSLGVDTKIWTPLTKKYYKDKFVVLCMTESTVRCGLDYLIPAYGEAFSGKKDCLLYIKDRNATDTLKIWIKEQALKYNIEIFHDDRHLEDHEEEKRILEHADCHIYLSRSATWGMTMTQSMACGVPTISMRFSGPTDYLSHRLTGLAVDYDIIDITQYELEYLKYIGMRSFFFPLNYYPKTPSWAIPKKESIKNCLLELYEDKNLREKLSNNGIMCANTFSWERSAYNMQFVLNKFDNSKSNN